MLIKSPNLVNVYRPASFADWILKDGEVLQGKWCPHSLQVSQTGQNVSLYTNSLRKKFMGYFVNDGAVE